MPRLERRPCSPQPEQSPRSNEAQHSQTIEQVLVYGGEKEEIKQVDSAFWANQFVYFLESLHHNVSLIGLTQNEVQEQFTRWLEQLKNN